MKGVLHRIEAIVGPPYECVEASTKNIAADRTRHPLRYHGTAWHFHNEREDFTHVFIIPSPSAQYVYAILRTCEVVRFARVPVGVQERFVRRPDEDAFSDLIVQPDPVVVDTLCLCAVMNVLCFSCRSEADQVPSCTQRSGMRRIARRGIHEEKVRAGTEHPQ